VGRRNQNQYEGKLSHRVFIIFLIAVGVLAPLSLMLIRWDYYTTPLSLRPFRQDYAVMKPSGAYSHGLGILGSLFIVTGVTLYSSRKRLRVLRDVGKLSWWLEVHIFLCLIGPILVTYHTTFKAGGIAAISLWTMLSVVASGIIGRFLYVLVPRDHSGEVLSLGELNSAIEHVGTSLRGSLIGSRLVTMIDEGFRSIAAPRGILDTLVTLLRLQRLKQQLAGKIRAIVGSSYVGLDEAQRLRELGYQRASLLQKSILLDKVKQLFFYWHAIHLPFTIIMFITLALHVTVVVLLGYRWIF